MQTSILVQTNIFYLGRARKARALLCTRQEGTNILGTSNPQYIPKGAEQSQIHPEQLVASAEQSQIHPEQLVASAEQSPIYPYLRKPCGDPVVRESLCKLLA